MKAGCTFYVLMSLLVRSFVRSFASWVELLDQRLVVRLVERWKQQTVATARFLTASGSSLASWWYLRDSIGGRRIAASTMMTITEGDHLSRFSLSLAFASFQPALIAWAQSVLFDSGDQPVAVITRKTAQHRWACNDRSIKFVPFWIAPRFLRPASGWVEALKPCKLHLSRFPPFLLFSYLIRIHQDYC